MDSPVRQYLKQKDYLRHKLFRKIKRRRAAERQLAIDAPIREMKRRVRLKRYDEGKLPDDQYYSIMEQVAELNNPEWNRLRLTEGVRPLSVDEEYLRILNDNTYDYRGYYNKYPNGDGNAIDHWTDEFKTVWHPTFSIFSRYSGIPSQYNPTGRLGGVWNGDEFVPVWGLRFNSGKDSNIHIKPENRGKFTALKKRTGKTTELLTHSKNPLTRKRAVFALNARKWGHK